MRIRSNGEESEARDEGFCFSLQLFCCPKLTWLSFIAIISIIEFIAFFISIGLYGLSNEKFLAPDMRSMSLMGAADAKSTKNDNQWYRIVMPALLHANLEHIAGNVTFQLIIGSGIEYGIGFWRMAILYILTEIGGVMLAITFHPESYGVGASCAGYGLIGFLGAYLFSNFSYMSRKNFWQIVWVWSISSIFVLMN